MTVYDSRKAGYLPGWRDVLKDDLVDMMKYLEAQGTAIDRAESGNSYCLLPWSPKPWVELLAASEWLRRQWTVAEVEHGVQNYREPSNLGIRAIPVSVPMGDSIRSASSENDPMGCEVIPPLTPPRQVTHGASPPPTKRTRLA